MERIQYGWKHFTYYDQIMAQQLSKSLLGTYTLGTFWWVNGGPTNQFIYLNNFIMNRTVYIKLTYRLQHSFFYTNNNISDLRKTDLELVSWQPVDWCSQGEWTLSDLYHIPENRPQEFCNKSITDIHLHSWHQYIQIRNHYLLVKPVYS